MSHGIVFGENSMESKKVFYIQKRIIRIMAGAKRRASCRELFKNFNILPPAGEFLLSLLSSIVYSMEKFQTNSDIIIIIIICNHVLDPNGSVTVSLKRFLDLLRLLRPLWSV
jgi:hypothetical protein